MTLALVALSFWAGAFFADHQLRSEAATLFPSRFWVGAMAIAAAQCAALAFLFTLAAAVSAVWP